MGTKFGQNPLKDVDSRVFSRMLWKEGSVTISFRNFVGERIKKSTLFDTLGLLFLLKIADRKNKTSTF
jgi:hypothetical protein